MAKHTSSCLLILFAALFARHARASFTAADGVCTIIPEPDGSDDVPSILAAFETCNADSTVQFLNETYHIESVMSTLGLRNVTVDLQGTLLVRLGILLFFRARFIDHFTVGNQHYILAKQQSSPQLSEPVRSLGFRGRGPPLPWPWIWYLRRERPGLVRVADGSILGRYSWKCRYDFSHGTSNLFGRPINFVIRNSTNFYMNGVRFVQSQFWSLTTYNASNVLMENIFISSTSNNGVSLQPPVLVAECDNRSRNQPSIRTALTRSIPTISLCVTGT